MISINVGGNRPGTSPCFPEHVDTQAGGARGKRGRRGGRYSRCEKKTRRNRGGAEMQDGGESKLHSSLNQIRCTLKG